MSRALDALYAGAVGRATLALAAAAGRGFALVPKLDGCYCVATTDSRGRLVHLVSRNGRAFPSSVAGELAGVTWAPDSIVIAELEVWTEAANRTAACRGWRALHLFDALRVAGRDVSSEPYHARRDALLRAESELVNEDLDRPWTADEHGLSHDPSSGRFVRPVPMRWRRMRVVPQLPAAQAELAWAEWVEQDLAGGPAEGLVLVALESRLGGRGAKRKVKATRSIDAVVVSVGQGAARVTWAGHTFVVSAVGAQLELGQVVEIQHDGWLERSVQPRCARIVRARPDLERRSA